VGFIEIRHAEEREARLEARTVCSNPFMRQRKPALKQQREWAAVAPRKKSGAVGEPRRSGLLSGLERNG
jgi:hypothetical protein